MRLKVRDVCTTEIIAVTPDATLPRRARLKTPKKSTWRRGRGKARRTTATGPAGGGIKWKPVSNPVNH